MPNEWPLKKVEEIAIPWKMANPPHTVVDIEFPEDRPRVVDLVFDDGLRMAETRGALYTKQTDGSWDYPEGYFDKGGEKD